MSHPTYRGGQGAPVQLTLEATRPSAQRRIARNGTSWSLTIPRTFLLNLNLLPGDVLEMVLYEEHGGFFVRPVMRRSQLPPPPAIAPASEPAR